MVRSGTDSSELAFDGIYFECPIPCPTELNGDGVTNGGDLAILLAAWGECA